ncbi:hypothetical protein H4582DRAFT_2063238 [Lactarius indigo]|nr:hypothetical protein H4582DRAFT_2063238 [Lactarius indigo]
MLALLSLMTEGSLSKPLEMENRKRSQWRVRKISPLRDLVENSSPSAALSCAQGERWRKTLVHGVASGFILARCWARVTAASLGLLGVLAVFGDRKDRVELKPSGLVWYWR